MKVDTHLNILISYAYMTSSQFCKRVIELVRNKKINVMIDSGAFTKHNAKGVFSHINVDNYCNFLEKYEEIAEKYVMLDVIGKAKESRTNYITMVKRGFNPMFVVTMYDNDYDFMRDAVDKNKNICVAGGATTKNAWMQKRFQDIYKFSNQKAQIHGLAFVTYPLMLRLPLYSVDSSSWKAAPLRFGQLQYFDRGLKSISYQDVLKRKSKLSFKQQKVLHNLGVSRDIYANVEYHKGNYSIEALGSIQANITMQKVCKRNGLDFFLAISNIKDLDKILYVNDNYNDLDYLKFRKEFTK